MGDIILGAFIDTLTVLPFLLVMNFLIEFIEYRSGGFKANKLLLGGAAPALGTAVGMVPQCGFSVVATELYSKKKIALGTLLAVYIATSDEALPIMLSSGEGLTKLWPVLIIKVCFALIVGYCAFGLGKLFNRKNRASAVVEHGDAQISLENKTADSQPRVEHDHDGNHKHDREHEHDHDEEGDEAAHIHGCHHHSFDEHGLDEKATGKQKAAWVWNVFLKHPLIHTGTVIFFIFAVNVAFELIMYYVGKAQVTEFLDTNKFLQPVFSALVGLIPNCAGSVIITEFYVVGGLSLGGVVSGLCVSAGIGYAVLIRQNRPVKNTVAVISIMYGLSVAVGIAITLLSSFIVW